MMFRFKTFLVVASICLSGFPSNSQQEPAIIILKMDDLEYKSPEFAQNWERYVDTIRSYEINSGLGIIIDQIANSPQTFRDSLSSWDANAQFEVWHHGWDHTKMNLPPDSANQGEFKGTPYEYQKSHLEQGSTTAREELGIEMHSFGAPYNKTDEVFTRVISESETIKVWMYCDDPSYSGMCLARGESNKLESKTGVVSFDSFLLGYNANTNPYLVLQGHPGKWDDNSFEEFEKVINFLKKQNHKFMLPYDYYLQTKS